MRNAYASNVMKTSYSFTQEFSSAIAGTTKDQSFDEANFMPLNAMLNNYQVNNRRCAAYLNMIMRFCERLSNVIGATAAVASLSAAGTIGRHQSL